MQPNQNPNLQPNLAMQPGEAQSKVELTQAPATPEVAPPAAQNPASASAPQAAPVQPPASGPVPNTVQQPVQNAAPAAGSNPVIAEDVDVIEKEWVDQAEKVIDRTKDDPYQEEESVEAMQVDYLKKRYGHDVKRPEENV